MHFILGSTMKQSPNKMTAECFYKCPDCGLFSTFQKPDIYKLLSHQNLSIRNNFKFNIWCWIPKRSFHCCLAVKQVSCVTYTAFAKTQIMQTLYQDTQGQSVATISLSLKSFVMLSKLFASIIINPMISPLSHLCFYCCMVTLPYPFPSKNV